MNSDSTNNSDRESTDKSTFDDSALDDSALDNLAPSELQTLEQTARSAMVNLADQLTSSDSSETISWPAGWPSVADESLSTAEGDKVVALDRMDARAGSKNAQSHNEQSSDAEAPQHFEPPALDSYVAPDIRTGRFTKFRLGAIAAGLLLVALGGFALFQRSNDDLGVAGEDSTIAELEIGDWRRLPQAPLAGREGHSAVWTGQEMIVFGGAPNSSLPEGENGEAMEEGPTEDGQPSGGKPNFADGAAYNPDTNRWRLVAPAPFQGRSSHAASWTDEGMFIGGGVTTGLQSGQQLTDAWLYRPQSDSWLQLPDLPAPVTNRTVGAQTFAVSNGRFVVVDALRPSTDGRQGPSALLAVLDLAQTPMTWETVETPASDTGNLFGLAGRAMSGTGQDHWLVLRSSNPFEVWVSPMPTTETEDITWRQLQESPIAGLSASYIVVGNQLVGAKEFGTGDPPMVSLDLAAGEAATWQTSSQSPNFDWVGTLAAGNDVVVSWRRQQVVDVARDQLFELEEPAGFELGELPAGGTEGVWTGEEILYFGGRSTSWSDGQGNSRRSRRVSLGFALPITRPGARVPNPVVPPDPGEEPADDAPTDTDQSEPEPPSGPLGVGEWRTLPEPPLAGREGHSAVWSGEEMIVWGGTPDTGDNSAGSDGETITGSNFADGAAYNPATNTWRSIEPAPFGGRSGHAATWTDQGLFVAGGSTEGIANVSDGAKDAWLYRPDSDDWIELPSLADSALSNMQGSDTAAISNGRFVVVITAGDLHILDLATEPLAWETLPSPAGAVSPQHLAGRATAGTGTERWLVVHTPFDVWVSPMPESDASEIEWRELNPPGQPGGGQVPIGKSVVVGDRLYVGAIEDLGRGSLASISLAVGGPGDWQISDHSPNLGFAAQVAIGDDAFLVGSTRDRALIDVINDEVIGIDEPDDRRIQSSFGHEMVWTGEEVIIFGGRTGSFDGSPQRRVTTGIALKVDRAEG